MVARVDTVRTFPEFLFYTTQRLCFHEKFYNDKVRTVIIRSDHYDNNEVIRVEYMPLFLGILSSWKFNENEAKLYKNDTENVYFLFLGLIASKLPLCNWTINFLPFRHRL